MSNMVGAGYEPFVRGKAPVGVRTTEWRDTARSRTLPIEIYYPANQGYFGSDLDPAEQDVFTNAGSMLGDGVLRKQAALRDAEPAAGDFPILLYAHGYSGDRREFSGLCTHLASHGYRVVSADHVGSTYLDVHEQISGSSFNRRETLVQLAGDRLGDIPFMLNAAEREFSTRIERAGVSGASLGGWTSLIAPSVDVRVHAIAPLCPGGGDGPVAKGFGKAIGEHLSFNWRGPAAVLTIVGDRDTWLPLYGQLAMFEACPVDDKALVVMKSADHQHFVDDMEEAHEWYRHFTAELAEHDPDSGTPWAAMAPMILPFRELMPEAEARKILFGLVTQHMDAHIKELQVAQERARTLERELERRELGAYVIRLGRS